MFVYNVDCFSFQGSSVDIALVPREYWNVMTSRSVKMKYSCMLWITCTLASRCAGNIVT
jgi:hypothetical protein